MIIPPTDGTEEIPMIITTILDIMIPYIPKYVSVGHFFNKNSIALEIRTIPTITPTPKDPNTKPLWINKSKFVRLDIVSTIGLY